MFKNITTLSAFFVAAVLLFSGCKKAEYSFGAIKTPTGLTLNTVIAVSYTHLDVYKRQLLERLVVLQEHCLLMLPLHK